MTSFEELWRGLLPIGRVTDTGGYRRFSWTPDDVSCREWFASTAASLGLSVEVDRNGNQWAWWGAPGPDAVVTGSHLDSVPDGGAFDGPLGVVSSLAAVGLLKARGVTLSRPLATTSPVPNRLWPTCTAVPGFNRFGSFASSCGRWVETNSSGQDSIV